MRLDNATQRNEIKFKIFAQDFPQFYAWISTSNFTKAFPDRKVNSLYFDTADNSFAFANMTGQSNRIKARARWYGDFFTDKSDLAMVAKTIDINFEIKRKLNSLGDKLSFPWKKSLAVNTTFFEFSKDVEIEFKKKLEKLSIVNSHLLRCAVNVSYNRKYYVSRSNMNLRLTIDNDLRYLRHLSWGRPTLLSRDYLICEIKYPMECHSIALQELGSFPGRRVRFSKYLAAMAQLKNISY